MSVGTLDLLKWVGAVVLVGVVLWQGVRIQGQTYDHVNKKGGSKGSSSSTASSSAPAEKDK